MSYYAFTSIFLLLGAAVCAFGFWRLTSTHRVNTRDGISPEVGYHTPKPRWGFVVLGALLLLFGYALIQAHGAFGR